VDKKFLLIGIIISLFLIVPGCNKKTDEPEPIPAEEAVINPDLNLAVSNLTIIDPVTIDTVTKQNYNLAQVKAQEWQPDAVLVSFSIKFPQNLAVGQSDETFIFGSANDTKNWWSFSISEETSRYIRAIIPKEDYLGVDIKPIDKKFWQLNYAQAFQLAELNGGQQFRQTNPNTSITATLHNTQPREWLWWVIEYKSGVNKYVIKVNPFDSQVVDESGNPLSAGTTTQDFNTSTTDMQQPQTYQGQTTY